VREIYQDGKSFFWTNSLIEKDGLATAVCSLPKVFLHTPIVFHEARSILQETRKSLKLKRFSLCDYHHVKFFTDVYREKHLLLRKNTRCANQSRLKKSQLWPWSQKWSVRKPRIPQQNNNRKKGKTISYLKNICEPHFFRTTC